MNELIEQSISCPYCGENIHLVIDGSIPEQGYIEDCQVCCRPINLHVSIASGSNIQVVATSENE